MAMVEENQVESQVVSIDDHREMASMRKQEKSIVEYLQVLSFSEIIVEAESVILLLNSGSLNREIFLKTKLILGEISNRLKLESSHLDKTLQAARKKIEEKFANSFSADS